jgi:hypothetical protein
MIPFGSLLKLLSSNLLSTAINSLSFLPLKKEYYSVTIFFSTETTTENWGKMQMNPLLSSKG